MAVPIRESSGSIPGLRVRYSLQKIQSLYDTGEDRKPLETLVRAFVGLQARKADYDLPPEVDKSFFRIAGFHGEPFEGVGKYDASWWGGYCHHNDVLFPVWHRAYLFHLESAMREIPGCADVSIPFWDELVEVLNSKDPKDWKNPIPTILTSPKFDLDGESIDNPLFSYKFQQSLVEVVTKANERYSKHKGYKTVRYPCSGLVGTEEDRENTYVHNAKYTQEQRVTILNKNILAWMSGEVQIDKSGDPVPPPKNLYPDTFSVKSRYLACLKVPEYTPFSNKTSMLQWQEDHKIGKHDLVAIEDPHNAIHLSLGGFYQEGKYNADEVRGANGDMGDNETAGFDPIFFFHHAFIDYVFWTWQKRHNLTEPGSLVIDPTSPGAVSVEGSIGFAPKTPLTQDSFLVPFRNPLIVRAFDDDDPLPWFTARTVTNIETQLGYTYGPGSLTDIRAVPAALSDGTTTAEASPIVALKASPAINRAKYPGSFVIRTYAHLPSGRRAEIGREAILSRYNLAACGNCQTKLTAKAVTPVSKGLIDALLAEEEDGDKDEGKIKYSAVIQHRNLDTSSGADQPFGFLHSSPELEVGDL